MATPVTSVFPTQKFDSDAFETPSKAPTRTELLSKWLSKNRLILITTALAAAAAIAVVVVSLFFPPAMLALGLLILASMPAYAALGTGAAAAAIATAAIVAAAAVYSLSGLGALVTFGVTKGYNAVISRRHGSSKDNHSDDGAQEDRTELLAAHQAAVVEPLAANESTNPAPSRLSTLATFLATQLRRLKGIGEFAPLASKVEHKGDEPPLTAAAATSQASSGSTLPSGLGLTAARSAAVPSAPGQMYSSTASLRRTSSAAVPPPAPPAAAADLQRARTPTPSDTGDGTAAASPRSSRHSFYAAPPVGTTGHETQQLSHSEEASGETVTPGL